MTQSQRENILSQVSVLVPMKTPVPVSVPIPVPVPVPVPVQVKTEVKTPVPLHAPVKVAVAVPVPTHTRRGACTSPLPPVKQFYDHITKSQNYDPTYDDIYKNDSQFSMHNSDVFKSPQQPIVRDYAEKMYGADMESVQSENEESHYPSVATAGAFDEQISHNVVRKTRKKVDVSLLNPHQLEQRRKDAILNKTSNDRAQAEKVASRPVGKTACLKSGR